MRARWLGWQWLGLGLLCLSGLATAQQTELEDVRVWASPERTRVVFDLSAPVRPDLFMLDNPARLVVDIPDTAKTGNRPEAWAGKGVIKQLRTGVRQGKDLRVVLDLAHLEIDPESFTLLPNKKYGHRLVVDLKGGGTESIGNDAAPEPLKTVAGAASEESRSEPVAHKPASPVDDIVIAIDAGHGGEDPGAIGPRGTYEKDVVLAISRRLASMVNEQPNMRAVLTRDGDYYAGLRQRMVEARKAKADLFVSIHANAFGDPGVHGASVYALSMSGATSEHARWLAERENAADLVGGVSLQNKDATLASFMLDLAQSASIEASLDAGDRVLRELGGLGPLHKSQVQQAGFVVLKSPDIPSFLVETAFISNPEEARKLRSDGYQTQLARAILRGIKGYFASYRPSTMIVEGQVHQVAPGETLSEIAQSYRVKLNRLRSYNDMQGNTIRAGDELRIPPMGSQQVAGLR